MWHPELSTEASRLFFRRFSAELARLASDLGEFQSGVSMLAAASLDADATMRIQALDELVQRAQALAGVADHMTVEAPTDSATIERIVNGIGLQALAMTLSGQGYNQASQEGEFQLF